MNQTPLPERTAVSVEHTWDTASVYPNTGAWRDALTMADATSRELHAQQGTLHRDAAHLAAVLDGANQVLRDALAVAMVAFSEYSVDTTNQAAAARNDQGRGLLGRVAAALAFIEPELMEMEPAQLQAWCRTEPALAIYAHYVERLTHRRAHTRTAAIEELLGALADPFATAASIHGVLTNADLVFAPAQGDDGTQFHVAQSTISALITHAERSVRRNAWENYADAHLAHKNTMAACLITGVKQHVFQARARGYDSCLEATLDPEAVPTAVFHILIDTFRQHLPTWHRYWRVRRRALGVDMLHEYDVKAPLTAQSLHLPYRQAVDWIAAGMAPLGEEYVATLVRGATEERWVDIYPNRGKRAGAYSYGVPGTHPFIMMSYTDDLYSLSTLAHELGHSMHSYLTWQNQPLVYSHYSLFAAEVASNFNQAMVRAHLFNTLQDRDAQIGIIEEAMANFHRYFFIMPTLARFELAVHERVEQGDSPSADDLTELMADLFAEGYGDVVTMDRARTGITWAQFSSHLYANFYVYQYATGISGAHALAGKILAGEPGAVERYLTFLRTGGAQFPLDALRIAGVDLATPAPIEATFAVLSDLVDRLEQLTTPGKEQDA